MVNQKIWRRNVPDSHILREDFNTGIFDPKNYDPEDIQKSRSVFKKYDKRNFRKNVKNISQENLRVARDLNREIEGKKLYIFCIYFII